MGGIFRDPRMKNPKGTAAFVIWYKDVSGRRLAKKTNAVSLGEARSVLASIEADILKAKAAGLTSTEQLKHLTFSEYVDTVYMGWSETSNRKSTATRKKILYANLKGYFGNKPLSSITSQDVRDFITKRLAGKIVKGKLPRPATVNRERAFLSSVLNMAWMEGKIRMNPARPVKALEEGNRRDRVFSDEEEAAIRKGCPLWLRELFDVGINTGMRVSEILHLQWADVDFRRRFIYVADSKTHEPRNIDMNSTVHEILKAKAPFPGQKVEQPYVFTNPETKKPYNVSSVCHAFNRVRKAVEKAGEAANLAGLTFHRTRHTFVSRMIEAGQNPLKVKAQTGHKTDAMFNRYLHLAPDGLSGSTEVLVSRKANLGNHAELVQNVEPAKLLNVVNP